MPFLPSSILWQAPQRRNSFSPAATSAEARSIPPPPWSAPAAGAAGAAATEFLGRRSRRRWSRRRGSRRRRLLVVLRVSLGDGRPLGQRSGWPAGARGRRLARRRRQGLRLQQRLGPRVGARLARGQRLGQRLRRRRPRRLLVQVERRRALDLDVLLGRLDGGHPGDDRAVLRLLVGNDARRRGRAANALGALGLHRLRRLLDLGRLGHALDRGRLVRRRRALHRLARRVDARSRAHTRRQRRVGDRRPRLADRGRLARLGQRGDPCRQVDRRIALLVQIGDHVGPVLRIAQPGIAHLGAGHPGLWVLEKVEHLLGCPVAAMRRHRVRIAKAVHRRNRTPDHVVERRPHLVHAGLDRVAGRARPEDLLAGSRIGLGEQRHQVDLRRLGRLAAAGGLLDGQREGQHLLLAMAELARAIDLAREEVQQQEDQQRAQSRTGDLVEVRRVHSLCLRGPGP